MNKNTFFTDFLIGGCIGKTLIEVSGIIANFVTNNNDTDTIAKLKSLLIIFIIGGIVYNLVIMSIRKMEKRDMKSKERQQLLKKQMYITASAILVFSIFLIVYSIKDNFVGVILALSFCTIFSFWGYSFLLSYITLKNSIALINKKKFKTE